VAGTLQGSIAYIEYCVDEKCDFSKSYDADVNFIVVVISAGICASIWVSSYNKIKFKNVIANLLYDLKLYCLQK